MLNQIIGHVKKIITHSTNWLSLLLPDNLENSLQRLFKTES